MTTNNHTLAVRTALYQNPGAAEKQLAVIGNEHGDSQLAIIVADLSTPEILIMSDEFDMTKPSIISAFLTAEQFNELLDHKAAEWGGIYGNQSLNSIPLIEIREKIENFICPIVYAGGTPTREDEMLAVLHNHVHGPKFAFLSGLGTKEFNDILNGEDERIAHHGTWQSLVISFRRLNHKEFKEIAHFYREETADGGMYEEHDIERVAQSILNDLAAESKPEIQPDEEPEFLTF